MRQVLSSYSAFKYYRIPPQILELMKAVDLTPEISERMKLPKSYLVDSCLGLPLSLIYENSGPQRSTSNFSKRATSWEFPAEAVVESEKVGLIASPAFTLFTLARDIPLSRLVMCIYEMCGSFAIFNPSDKLERALVANSENLKTPESERWRRVVDVKTGDNSNLWMRKPLVSKDELMSLYEKLKGRPGSRNFKEAIDRVTGVCASPLEVQVSMLLAMPRSEGGARLNISNNVEIEFPDDIEQATGRKHCFADIVASDNAGKKVIVECQGSLVHNNLSAALNDVDRAAALQSLGLDVLFLTYKQIVNAERFGVIVRCIKEKFGKKYRRKSDWYIHSEEELRKDLFGEWERLPEQTYDEPKNDCWWYY